MKENMQFPEFEKLIKKEYPSVYHEELDHLEESAIGLLVISISVTLLAITGYTSGVMQTIGLFLLLVGIILCCRGVTLNRMSRKKYEFRGLSRKTISKAIMYLDSKIVQPTELESPAPYHGKLAVSQNDFIQFVNKTVGTISWSSDFINNIQKDSERLKKRFILLPLCALVLTLFLVSVTYTFWTSESSIMIYVGIALGINIVGPTVFCLAESLYIYVRLPVLRKSAQIYVSDSQNIEDSLSGVFTLLQTEYQYPLRVHVARVYPILEYTGRTKTSYSLVRLKEAVLYPRDSIQNEIPL